MLIVDKLINTTLCRITLLMISVTLYSHHVYATNFEVIGNVIKGTCTVSVPNQVVLFSAPLDQSAIKSAIDDRTYVKPFSISYNCDDFDIAHGAVPYLMRIAPSSNTAITTDNRIYPTQNETNAAFVLSSCNQEKKECHIVNFALGGNVSFDINANGNAENYFEVSVVKLNTEEVKSGELIAAVDVTFIQP